MNWFYYKFNEGNGMMKDYYNVKKYIIPLNWFLTSKEVVKIVYGHYFKKEYTYR